MDKRIDLTLAEQLIACEATTLVPHESTLQVSFRVCDKLRQSLSVLTGAEGFRALLIRAVKLSSREAPAMASVGVTVDGSLEAGGSIMDLEGVSSEGALLLVGHLISLLITFIGEALTLRLVDKIWAMELSKALAAYPVKENEE